MPVPILGLKVRSDSQKVKFLMIFGRPKTGIFRQFRGVPGHCEYVTRCTGGAFNLPNLKKELSANVPFKLLIRSGGRTPPSCPILPPFLCNISFHSVG